MIKSMHSIDENDCHSVFETVNPLRKKKNTYTASNSVYAGVLDKIQNLVVRLILSDGSVVCRGI